VKVSLVVEGGGFGATKFEVTDKRNAENDMHYTNLIEAKVRQLIK